MDRNIAAGSGTWDDTRLVVLHRELLLTYASFPLELIFLGVGVVASGASMVLSIKHKEPALQSVPLLSALANYIVILVFMKIDWFRYYIPTMTADRILVSVGIYIVTVQALHMVDGIRRSLPSR